MKTWYDTKKRVASCTQNEQQQNAMLQVLATGGKWREKMDEDDYIRLMTNQHYQCPYYRNGDDYLVVRKQLQNHRKSKEVQKQKKE